MSQHPTHTVQLRDSTASAEQVTTAQLADMQSAIVGFATHYDVTDITPAVKPESLPKTPAAAADTPEKGKKAE